MGMSEGMNMSYEYHKNMNNFSNRPRFKSIGRGVGGSGSSGGGSSGGPIFSHPTKILTLSEVQNWLEKQQPYILRSVMKICSNVLVNKHKVPVDDLSDWHKEPEEKGKSVTILQDGVDQYEQQNRHQPSNQKGLTKKPRKGQIATSFACCGYFPS